MSEGRINVLPNFIKARSAEALRRLMLLNNANSYSQINYFDIQYSNGYWYAWFYQEINVAKEITNG